MSKKIHPSDTVQFNGKGISCVYTDDGPFVSVRHVCAALGVHYRAQLKKIKNDPFWGDAWRNLDTHLEGDRTRTLTCLSEEALYGWLFSIQSNNKGLLAYKSECHHVLYQHFKGSLTEREGLLKEISQYEMERAVLIREGQKHEWYQRLVVVDLELDRRKKLARKQDRKYIENQKGLFDQGEE